MSEAVVVNKPLTKRKKEGMFKQVCKRLVRNPVAMTGLIILLLIVLASIFAPLLAPYDPNFMDYSALKTGPSAKHLLGCDQLGRDILSRMLYGGRYSLALGFICAMIGLILGVFFGCIVGYAGGTVDNIAMRICDIWSSIPSMLLAILVSTALGNGFFNTVLAMTLGSIPGSVRNTRAMVLKERSQEYLEAAKAMNCSQMKIMFKHMMPNIIPFKIVGTTGNIGATIMQASSLSFIGLGMDASTPEWGAMCSSGRALMLTHPYMIIFPGLIILITVLAFNLFGDGLRDAMDPKLKD
ncbi:MAG: ABC transporter permease [Oscillospiraceae bacterium]